MISNWDFIILISLSGFVQCVIGKACEIDLDNKTLKHVNGKGRYPLFVDGYGDIIYPVGGRKLTFDNGDTLGLYCHFFGKSKRKQSYVSKSSIKPLKKNARYVPLKCNDGTFTLVDDPTNEAVDVYKAACTKKQYAALTKHVGETSLCSDIGADGRTYDLDNTIHSVQIGWNMSAINPDAKLTDMIQLCIDEKVYGTLWTRHIVRGKSIEHQDKGGSRPTFRGDNPGRKRFFNRASNKALNTLYKKKMQIKMTTYHGLQGIINGSSSSTNFFAKGHLSPDAAFIYQLEQYATYYFINVAPQFQAFNAGNWKALELANRQMAKRLQRNILTYTGTLDILAYENKDLYLWYKEYKTVTQAIPVPRYYWMIMYDEKADEGVAFLGLNDPYAADQKAADFLCTNVCDQISWLNDYVPKMDEEDRGHITCCTIGNKGAQKGLADVVSNVAKFKTDQGESILDAGLLTTL